jgi:glutamate 5-kinase
VYTGYPFLVVSKPIIIIKFGTASITRRSGEPDITIISDIAKQVAEIQKNYNIIIVSSGAVGAGKAFIQNYKGTISQKKAAAAVGNPLLIGLYSKEFEPYGISIAQGLCERQHFANRAQFLELKNTFEQLWKNNIIPIVNENDVVSDIELRFSDNDQLATLLAVGFGASSLMLCTSVGGLLNETGQIIPRVEDINSAFKFVRADKSSLGLGGMTSKLTYTRLAQQMGIRVVIFGISEENGLLNAINEGKGTEFPAKSSTLSSRNRWLASGGLSAGSLVIDKGATAALMNRKSLLAVGITKVVGEFASGEIVEIFSEGKETIAVARTRMDSKSISANLKTQNYEVAHANDIVLL